MADEHFIQKAIKRPGALTKKANAAGETPREFAEQHKHDSGLTGEQSRFMTNVLNRYRPKKKN